MHYWIENHLNLIQFSPYIFIASIIIFLLIGWLYGRYRLRNSRDIIVRDSLATAIFGLSALVLGFTFSGANDHFDQRSALLRQQASVISQVYQSSKYLNTSDRVKTQNTLKQILASRLAVYGHVKTIDDLNTNLTLLTQQLNSLNEEVTLSISRAPADTRVLADNILRSQLAQLINVFQAGILNAKRHPPAIIERFLFVLLSVGSLLSGYAMAVQKEEDWFLTALYLGLMGFALYVIFALEFPNQLFNFDGLNADFLRLQQELS